MKTATTGKGTFLFVEVHESGVVFYENMGYLIYKEPDYKNWVTDSDLLNPVKLAKFLERNDKNSDYKQAVIKLPNGNYKFVAVIKSGVLDRHEASQNLTEEIAATIVDDNGMGCWDNYRLKRDNKYTCTSAEDSVDLLLKSLGLDTTKNYAILKLI